MEQLETVTVENFEEKVLKNDKAIIVDFYADWCGPCKALAPTLEEIASEYEAKAKVVKVDVDASGELAQKYGIRGMPTILFFKSGEVKTTLVGNQKKQEIVNKLSEII